MGNSLSVGNIYKERFKVLEKEIIRMRPSIFSRDIYGLENIMVPKKIDKSGITVKVEHLGYKMEVELDKTFLDRNWMFAEDMFLVKDRCLEKFVGKQITIPESEEFCRPVELICTGKYHILIRDRTFETNSFTPNVKIVSTYLYKPYYWMEY